MVAGRRQGFDEWATENMATQLTRRTSLGHALSFGVSVSLLLSGGCAPVSEHAADQRELGVRAGVLVPGAADEGSSPSFAVGVFSAGRIPAAFGPPQSPFEVGLDLAKSSSDDGRVDTWFYAVYIDTLFFPRTSVPESGFYFHGGYRALLASSEVDGNRHHNQWNVGMDVGMGVASLKMGWDVRLTWTLLLENSNLEDLVLVTAGYRF